MATMGLICLVVLACCFNSSSYAFLDLFGAGTEEDYDPNRDPNDYGVDTSFPIHHNIMGQNAKSKDPIKRHFARQYEEHINGCYDMYSFRECDANERARFEMGLDQPKTQHNYTTTGFKKIRAPEKTYNTILQFWNENKDTKQKEELWPRGNTYVNHWKSPTKMVNFEDPSIPEGAALKQSIWNEVKPIIEEWTGKRLKPTSLYGIRVYFNNSILATHVDRLPLVSSCIIQVAQDVDEPWPIEVYGHGGKATNVTMQPGDMVLYESHSVLHGRPFPMQGRHYANVFVHFIPEDLEYQNQKLADEKAGRTEGGHEGDNHDGDTLQKHLKAHDFDNRGSLRTGEQSKVENSVDGQTALHLAAQNGDLQSVRKLVEGSTDGGLTLLNARDVNNWQAIHEAARGGHVAVLKYLVEMGADVSARTLNGGSPLFWARKEANNGNLSAKEAEKYLESIKAPHLEEKNV